MVVRMEVYTVLNFVPRQARLLFLVGLLVAACVNRAPEGTFGAAVAEVGVLDFLKVN